ncbi:hypothetical protein LTS18_002760, partial [Coniosporium uncinatum]
MKSLTLLALSLAGVAQSHYIFTTFSAGGTSAVRKNINNNSPITNLADPNLRCNAGGATGGSAQTVPVAAGSRVSFSADTPVYHQGPTSLYMTKVPSAAAADGSTPWFKIKDFGAKTGAGQASFDMAKSYDATIPRCLAPGDYLIRIQQIAIHNPGSPPQFYISCAQVKVTGGGSTVPPGVSIPGAFKASDPGLTAN